MTKKLPSYIRRDAFTGPISLAESRLPFRTPFIKRCLCGLSLLLAKFLVLAPGSREHYFHFLIGYLLPLIHAQSRNRFEKFLALDCGPLMTPILEETLDRCGCNYEIVPPEAIERPVTVDPWDSLHKPWKSTKAVRSAADLIRHAWQKHSCPAGNCPQSENLLIQRSRPHEHYLNGKSEFSGYGMTRRAVSNLPEVSDFLTQNGVSHSIYEPGTHSLGCQIATFTMAKRLLGFRGAEWANLIWSSSESRVRMLDHTPPAKTLNRFMTMLGIRHEFKVVNSQWAPENPQGALRFFTET